MLNYIIQEEEEEEKVYEEEQELDWEEEEEKSADDAYEEAKTSETLFDDDDDDDDDDLLVPIRAVKEKKREEGHIETFKTEEEFIAHVRVDNIANKVIKVNAVRRKLQIDIRPRQGQSEAFRKNIPLPTLANAKKAKTSFAKGLLIITVPLAKA